MSLFLKSKKLDIKTNDVLIAIIHSADAEAEGLVAGNAIHLKWASNANGISMVIDITSSLVEKGQIGIFSDFYQRQTLKDSELIQIEMTSVAESTQYIREKLQGKHLDEHKLDTIIKDIALNRLSPVMISYYVGAGYSPGFNEEEILSMTKSIAMNGETFKFDGIVADKHSIGGVAGKGITPIVIPIVSCLENIIVPNTSSRAVTSASATTDMLEVIMKMSFSKPELMKMIDEQNVFMVWGGGLDLAPADDQIIRVQKQLGIESIDKFVASIMAKKIAQGVNHVVFDVPMGPGAKISTEEEYEEVKTNFEKLGKYFNINVRLHKRYVNSIDGHSVGPSLECVEFLKIFEADLVARSRNLDEDAIDIASDLISLVRNVDFETAKLQALDIFNSGKAYKRLKQIIKRQGGNENITANDIEIGALRYDFKSKRNGVIKTIDNKNVFDVCKALGNPFVKEAGMYFHKFPGENVREGEVLSTLFATNQNRLDLAVEILSKLNVFDIE